MGFEKTLWKKMFDIARGRELKGIEVHTLFEKSNKYFPLTLAYEFSNASNIIKPRRIIVPHKTTNSYAIAAHYRQEPDLDSLEKEARSALDWEKTGYTFMAPLERIIAGMRWHIEKDSSLDGAKYLTMCPGVRTEGDWVPYFIVHTYPGTSYPDYTGIGSFHPDSCAECIGVRRVITKDTKV